MLSGHRGIEDERGLSKGTEPRSILGLLISSQSSFPPIMISMLAWTSGHSKITHLPPVTWVRPQPCWISPTSYFTKQGFSPASLHFSHLKSLKDLPALNWAAGTAPSQCGSHFVAQWPWPVQKAFVPGGYSILWICLELSHLWKLNPFPLGYSHSLLYAQASPWKY